VWEFFYSVGDIALVSEYVLVEKRKEVGDNTDVRIFCNVCHLYLLAFKRYVGIEIRYKLPCKCI
jgi:hypothetical protein